MMALVPVFRVIYDNMYAMARDLGPKQWWYTTDNATAIFPVWLVELPLAKPAGKLVEAGQKQQQSLSSSTAATPHNAEPQETVATYLWDLRAGYAMLKQATLSQPFSCAVQATIWQQ